MSVLSFLPLIWAQAFMGVPEGTRRLYLLGEPALSLPGPLGGLITWTKVISLFCLMGWVVAWVAALKERWVSRPRWLDIAALVRSLAAWCLLLPVLETTGRIKSALIGGISSPRSWA